MTDPVVLDSAILQAFRESLGPNSGEVFNTVLQLFVSDAPSLVLALQKSLQANDLRAMQRAAHTLRSNSQTVGATGLAGLSRDLETSCRLGDRSHWAEQVTAIETLFPQVLLAVQGELDQSLPASGA
jgi:histidine phosphotransfer protein HptB